MAELKRPEEKKIERWLVNHKCNNLVVRAHSDDKYYVSDAIKDYHQQELARKEVEIESLKEEIQEWNETSERYANSDRTIQRLKSIINGHKQELRRVLEGLLMRTAILFLLLIITIETLLLFGYRFDLAASAYGIVGIIIGMTGKETMKQDYNEKYERKLRA